MTQDYDDDYGYDWQPPRDEDGRGFDDAYPFEGDEGADRWADEEDEPAPARRYADEEADEADEKYDHHDLLEQREEVHCPVAKRCGGCEWLAMPYDMQLERKQDYIEELFADYPVEVEPLMCMVDPRGYRNKVQLPFAPGKGKDGQSVVRWGIFEKGSHWIVPCKQCMVEDPAARPIIATVARLMPEFGVTPYSEKTFEGCVRYALVRIAHATGEIMLTLVCNAEELPEAFVDAILDAHPEVTTVVLNTNTERTSVILGKQERVLYGPGYIEDILCGCRFRISSSSFYQTNPIAAEALYEVAIEMAHLTSSDRIGDAYCGTGTIGIVAAKASGAELIGIERNGDAVRDAEVNAQLNGIEDATFVTADAGSEFARMARRGEKLDVVFMDPPRAGSSQAFLANLSRLGPSRVVYISCEPKTQVRDIKALVRNGYRIKRICPVDMFPHTDHVENVVLLERGPRHEFGARRTKKRA